MTSHNPEHVTGSHGRGERHFTVEVENRRKNSAGLCEERGRWHKGASFTDLLCDLTAPRPSLLKPPTLAGKVEEWARRALRPSRATVWVLLLHKPRLN